MKDRLVIPDYAINYILYVEGGYVDHKLDKGGATNYGISTGLFKLLKKKNLDFLEGIDSVKQLTKDIAIKIYDYLWRDYKISERYKYPVDLVMFDSYVQHNPVTVGRTAQRALNIVANKVLELNIPPLVDDGIIGPKTLEVFKKVQSTDFGRKALALELIIRRMYVYHVIVLNDPPQEEFLNGWLRRLNILHNTIFTDGRG